MQLAVSNLNQYSLKYIRNSFSLRLLLLIVFTLYIQYRLGARVAERSRIRLVSFLINIFYPQIHLSMLFIGHMYRTRFMRAFRKLKGEIVDEPLPTFKANSKSPEKVVYIVISEQVRCESCDCYEHADCTQI